jgi:hypothetical protein
VYVLRIYLFGVNSAYVGIISINIVLGSILAELRLVCAAPYGAYIVEGIPLYGSPLPAEFTPITVIVY